MKQLILALMLVALTAYAFAAAPVVTNVLASQTAGIVTIAYDLTADGACDVTLLVSNLDAEMSYNIFPTAVTGDIGNSVSNLPVAKTIIWDPAIDGMVPSTRYKVKVIARDYPVQDANHFQSFIRVAGGTFNNGVSDVTLSAFFMDKYEVTQAEFFAVEAFNPSNFQEGVGQNQNVINGPVERVTWFDAIQYCNKRSMQEGLTPCYSYNGYTDPGYWEGLNDGNQTDVSCDWAANGYRLPTEAEWEFAARGGNSTHGYTYSGSDIIGDVAWWGANYGGNSDGTTHPVGSLAANELGLYDMSGNVCEWNWDISGEYPPGDQMNPHGPVSGSFERVHRGGSWLYNADICTVFNRNSDVASFGGNYIGFRCVRNVPVP